MLDQLLNFISEQKLFQPDEKVLLAVSGGIDSMVMVDLFKQTNYKFSIAHCNFKLRGKESDDDQLLVEEMARSCNVPFFTNAFDTEAYAERYGISIQMSARDLRRDWFKELLSSEEYTYIATAHHLNDALETTLFNLTKGTGISGLKGILPKNDIYVRPMLFASREMIMKYANVNKITWREDKSNSTIKYHRNLIRHKVIPELRKINPGLEDTYSYSSEKIAASVRIFNKVVDQQRKRLLEEQGSGIRIEKKKIKLLDEPTLILFEVLSEFGFNYHQIKDMVVGMDGQPGKIYYSTDYQLVIDREDIFINRINTQKSTESFVHEDFEKIEIDDFHLTFEVIESNKVQFSDDNKVAFLDFDKLEFPLKIRKWEHGDWFHPLGMKHKKKLSDFMIDEKIPLNLKEQVFVVISGKDLVWVMGYRIDDRFKITNQTKKTFKICNIQSDDQSF